MIESVSGDTCAGVALQHATAVTRLTKSETDVPILTVASPAAIFQIRPQLNRFRPGRSHFAVFSSIGGCGAPPLSRAIIRSTSHTISRNEPPLSMSIIKLQPKNTEYDSASLGPLSFVTVNISTIEQMITSEARPANRLRRDRSGDHTMPTAAVSSDKAMKICASFDCSSDFDTVRKPMTMMMNNNEENLCDPHGFGAPAGGS